MTQFQSQLGAKTAVRMPPSRGDLSDTGNIQRGAIDAVLSKGQSPSVPVCYWDSAKDQPSHPDMNSNFGTWKTVGRQYGANITLNFPRIFNEPTVQPRSDLISLFNPTPSM